MSSPTRRLVGRVANELLYRSDESRLQVLEHGRPWSFDGDGQMFRLVSEAHRIRLAHLFDPVLAVHTSLVDPLPHQITAVYEAMLPRQPLRFLLADDPAPARQSWPVPSRAGGERAIAPPTPSPRQKIVIFTQHREMLSHLEGKVTTLLGRNDEVVVIHGGMGREERHLRWSAPQGGRRPACGAAGRLELRRGGRWPRGHAGEDERRPGHRIQVDGEDRAAERFDCQGEVRAVLGPRGEGDADEDEQEAGEGRQDALPGRAGGQRGVGGCRMGAVWRNPAAPGR